MEQILMDYLANATWQIPLLAVAAWFFVRLGRFGPQTEHCIWLAVLALAVGLPLRGALVELSAATPRSCTTCGVNSPAVAARKSSAPVQGPHLSGVAGSRRLETITQFRGPKLRLSGPAADCLAGFYAGAFLFGLVRIVRAWLGARRLVADSRAIALPPQWRGMLEDAGRRMGANLPQLRKSGKVHSPVIVGAASPVLLLPENFDGNARDEAQAAIYHELAHVRRQDYLVNLICQIAALPIVWHPVTYGVQQRIRRTREMICDDIAAQQMQSEIGYAKCLLTIATKTLGQSGVADATQAIALFGDNMLEERIMRLMKEKSTMTMQVKLARVASGATVMIAAAAMAAFFHVTPTLAQSKAEVAPMTTQSTSVAEQATDGATKTAKHPVANQGSPIPPVASGPTPAKASARKSGTGTVPHRLKTADQKRFVIDLGKDLPLAPEEQARLQQERDAVSKQVAAVTKKLDSPEFKRQMADQMADLVKQQDELKKLDLAKIQQQVNDAMAQIDSPEFKRQMADLQKNIESGALKRSMEEADTKLKQAEAERQANFNALDMARFQLQIDKATAQIDSPEFKQKMMNLQKQIESGELQRAMQEINKKMEETDAQTNKIQTK